MSGVDLDPRWEWVEVQAWGRDSRFVKGRCNHLEVVPVPGVDGEFVAQLCLTCDQQLPAPPPV